MFVLQFPAWVTGENGFEQPVPVQLSGQIEMMEFRVNGLNDFHPEWKDFRLDSGTLEREGMVASRRGLFGQHDQIISKQGWTNAFESRELSLGSPANRFQAFLAQQPVERVLCKIVQVISVPRIL